MKKFLITVLVLAILIAGGIFGVRMYKESRKNSNPVNVYSVSNWLGNWYDNDTSLNGNIVLSDEQNIYIETDKIIKEIYVMPGDEVMIGDILMEYDMTQDELRLSTMRAELAVTETNARIAASQLAKLQKVVPIPDDAEIPKAPEEIAVEEAEEAVMAALEGCNDPDSELSFATAVRIEAEDALSSAETLLKSAEDEAAKYKDTPVFPGNPGTEDDPETPDIDETIPPDTEYIVAKTEFETKKQLADDSVSLAKKDYDDAMTAYDAAVLAEKSCQEASDKAHDALDNANDVLLKAQAALDEYYQKQLENPTLIYTKSELERALRSKNEEIRDINLDIQNQQLAIKRQEQAIEKGKVLSELNGTVQSVEADEESIVSGRPAIVVSSSGAYSAVVTVDEFSLDTIEIGETVSVMSYDTGGYYTGTVSKKSTTPQEGYSYYEYEASTYPVTIVIEDGDDLSEDMWVEVTRDGNSTTWDSRMNEIVLPLSMCKKENGSYYVMKMEDGRLTKQVIKTGKIYWGDQIVVKGGLSSDDYIAFPYTKDAVEGKVVREAEIDELYGY